jgi:hypothetical protein
MRALFPQFIHHTPAVPCSQCENLTSLSRVEARPDGRYTLVPVCDEHRASIGYPTDQHDAA